MGSWSFSGVFTACPDPVDVQHYGTMEVGAFVGGKPVRQGWPSALIKLPPTPSAGLNELYSRWLANKDAMTSGNIPALSGYGFKAMSGWYHEPLPTGWEGPIAHGITMLITRIGYY